MAENTIIGERSIFSPQMLNLREVSKVKTTYPSDEGKPRRPMICNAILFVCALVGVVTAANAQTRMATHNGSLVAILPAPGGGLVIKYAQPRPDLAGLVTPGTVLARGQWRGPHAQVFVGEAFIFSRLCGAIPYPVRGTVDQSQTLVLVGPAPQFDTSCRVIGYDIRSQHAMLRFEPTKQAPTPSEPPVAEAPAAPPQPRVTQAPPAPPAVMPPTVTMPAIEQAPTVTAQAPTAALADPTPQVSQTPAGAQPARPADSPGTELPMPDRQQQFIDILDDFAARYSQAPNEMAQGALRPQRAKAICSLMNRDWQVRGWLGKVKKMSSNNEGKGVIEISISPRISVKTWNNALSDIGNHTLLEPGSLPHTQAVQLRPGQNVEFSGTFLLGDKDCLRELSLTQRGSMSEPEWIFRFQTMTPRTAPGATGLQKVLRPDHFAGRSERKGVAELADKPGPKRAPE